MPIMMMVILSTCCEGSTRQDNNL